MTRANPIASYRASINALITYDLVGSLLPNSLSLREGLARENTVVVFMM